jgi:hypothetical protein
LYLGGGPARAENPSAGGQLRGPWLSTSGLNIDSTLTNHESRIATVEGWGDHAGLYDSAGTAAAGIEAHNGSNDAHSALFAAKVTTNAALDALALNDGGNLTNITASVTGVVASTVTATGTWADVQAAVAGLENGKQAAIPTALLSGIYTQSFDGTSTLYVGYQTVGSLTVTNTTTLVMSASQPLHGWSLTLIGTNAVTFGAGLKGSANSTNWVQTGTNVISFQPVGGTSWAYAPAGIL